MAKPYEAPSKRKDDDEDENEKLKQTNQNNPQTQPGRSDDPRNTGRTQNTPMSDPPNQTGTPTDQVNKEAQAASEKAGKERQAYLDEMNRRIEEVVNFASQSKDKNPQLLNLTSEALKNAADQIDAATPQGVARNRVA